jgi:hypothetical protein
MSMTNTVTADTLSPSEDAGGLYIFYSDITDTAVFVITFGDGRQIAASGIDDAESHDIIWGLPQDETVNLCFNGAMNGATVTFYEYDGTSLGTPIYTYIHSAGYTSAGLRIVYDPGAGQFDISVATDGATLDSSTGEYHDFQGTLVQTHILPACFLRGTLILTARGEVPVEALLAGDLVATRFGGLRAVTWIGTQCFEGRLAGVAHQPIRFAQGSLGGGMPSCDLFVSPGHAMLVQGGDGGDLLAHAGALVNGETITQKRVHGEIAYFHLDLGPHDCVLANGAWAESYFEDRNRDAFHNAAEFHARFPGHEPVRQATCLPILMAGHPGLAAVRRQLAPVGLRAAA